MAYYESFEEFEQRMGCECLPLRNRYLFANGAQSDGETGHGDPPTDPQQLIRLNHEFLSEKLRITIQEYRYDVSYLAQQSEYHAMGAGPMPPDGWKEHLAGLIKEINALKAQVAELEAQFDVSRQAQVNDERRTEERRAARGVQQILQRLPTF